MAGEKEGKTILLVEDDADFNAATERVLRSAGYSVLTALRLSEARAHLQACEPDAIVLDIMLPDGDGLAFCREVREASFAPVLFLTGLVADEDLLAGFRSGGDDYIRKPYNVAEFLARVDGILRRVEIEKARGAAQGGRVVAGPLALDIESGRAYLDGADMLLTQKQFFLLRLLLQNKGQTLSSKFLYETVWKQPLAGDGHALWTQISRLKQKLVESGGDAASAMNAVNISRQSGGGYRLEMD